MRDRKPGHDLAFEKQSPVQVLPAVAVHGRVALLMVGVRAELGARKPEYQAEAGDSLGAQLRRRRRDLRHRRIDAARAIGTSWKSLMWWERNEREPLDRFWPAIIAYLGREPWQEPMTLGEQLPAERRRRGLAIFEAAALVGVDEGTWWWWESNRRRPRYPRTKALVAAFLSAQLSPEPFHPNSAAAGR